MILEKYSFGVGDRFGHQGKAQLQAIMKAKEQGIKITPVWNKSHREHSIIKTAPGDVRVEADATVKALGWKDSYFVDADHIGLKNVDLLTSTYSWIQVISSLWMWPMLLVRRQMKARLKPSSANTRSMSVLW
jgi:hypothetical protein